ncbi:Zinc-uptake complex component A periplasmic [Candidatus Hepatincola sp. Pdp]
MKKKYLLLFSFLCYFFYFSNSYSAESNQNAKSTIDDSLVVVYNAPLQGLVDMITKGVYTTEVLFDPSTTHYFEFFTQDVKTKLNTAKYVVILDRDYNKNITEYLAKNNTQAKLIVASDMKKLRLLNPTSSFLQSDTPPEKVKTPNPPASAENKPAEQTNDQTKEQQPEEQNLANGEKLLDQNSVNFLNSNGNQTTGAPFNLPTENAVVAKSDNQLQDYNFYQDPKRAIAFLVNLRNTFMQDDTSNAETYAENYRHYRKVLRKLNDSIKKDISKNHKGRPMFYSNSWQYFQDAYGIPSYSIILTETAGAREYHKLTTAEINYLDDYVDKNKITCIFTEKQFDDLLLQKYIKEKKLRTATLSASGYNIANRSAISNYLYMLKRNAELFTYCSN